MVKKGLSVFRLLFATLLWVQLCFVTVCAGDVTASVSELFSESIQSMRPLQKGLNVVGNTSITKDGQEITLEALFVTPDNERVRTLENICWTTDLVCVSPCIHEDGRMTLTGKMDGVVHVTLSAYYGMKKYTASAEVRVSGQSEKLSASTIKLIAYGNSILSHSPNSALGWSGNWGMAASSEDKDYIHQLVGMLENKFGKGKVSYSIGQKHNGFEPATSEANQDTDWESKLAGLADYIRAEQPDIVTIQYGENSHQSSAAVYAKALCAFVAEVRKGAPDALVLLTTPFWSGAGMGTYDGAVQAAKNLDVPLADLAAVCSRPGSMATGQFENNGVAAHPGDEGMLWIAEEMFEKLNERLTRSYEQKYTVFPQELLFTNTASSISTDLGTLQLTTKILPADAAQEVVFRSSDENVATVDRLSGLVTGKNNGTVTITAESKYDPNVNNTFVIQVSGQSQPYRLHFEANTSDTVTGIPEDNCYAKGMQTFPKVYPERSTYYFRGWALSPDGEPVESVSITADTTVYAVWEKAHTWDFEREGHFAGFVAKNGFNARVTDGFLSAMATDTNAESGNVLAFVSPLLNIEEKEYATLVVHMQNNVIGKDTKLKLSVTTMSESAVWQENVSTTELTTYTFDLTSLEGTITGFTLEPTDVDTAVYIDEIYFTNDRILSYDKNTDDTVTHMPADICSEKQIGDQGLLISTQTPQREGYVFLGWNRKSDSKLLTEDVSGASLSSPLTLYAVWDKNDHWEFDTYKNDFHPEGIESFSFTNSLFCFQMVRGGSIDNLKKLGYTTDSTSKKLKVRAKWCVEDAENLKAICALWTDKISMYAKEAEIYADLSSYGAQPEDFVEFELDGTANKFFSDNILQRIRFYPINSPGYCEIDYIRFTDSQANIVVQPDTIREVSTDAASYIVKKNGTIRPQGVTYVNELYVSGNVDLSKGIMVAKKAFEAENTDGYQIFVLDMAEEDITFSDGMYIGETPVEMLDGATYVFPETKAVRFEKRRNEGSVALSIEGPTGVYIGTSADYKAVFSGVPENTEVRWMTSKSDVAQIDVNGHLVPKKPGKVRIMAVSTYDEAICAAIDVTVEYYRFSLSIEGESAVVISEQKPVYKAVFDRKLPDTGVLWSTSVPEMASVDAQGILTVHKPGNVILTAVSVYDPSVSAQMEISMRYADFSLEIVGPDAVTKDARSVEYICRVSGEYTGNMTFDWSVDDETLAAIGSNGRLTPKADGEITIRAVSTYDPTKVAVKKVKLSGQRGLCTVTYHAGTQDKVLGLPDPGRGRFSFELSDEKPTREGYVFLGWALDETSVKCVERIQLVKDTDVYALWGKGICYEFDGSTDGVVGVSGGKISLSPDGYLICDTMGTNGDIRLEFAAMDIDPEVYRTIQIGMSTDKKSTTQIYYKSMQDGALYGYNENGFADAERLSITKGHPNSGLDNLFVLEFPFYLGADYHDSYKGSWFKAHADSIQRIWVDITNADNATVHLDYLRILDAYRTVTFATGTEQAVTGMPDKQKVLWGETLRVSEAPAREGYLFVGWANQVDAPSKADNCFTVTDDMTLYAQWVKELPIDPEADTILLEELDCTTYNALLVKAAANSEVVLTGNDGENTISIQQKTNKNGYAVLDLSAFRVLKEGRLSGQSVQSVWHSFLDYAQATAEYVKQPASQPKPLPTDKTVEEVVNDRPLYTVETEETQETFKDFAGIQSPIIVNFDEKNDVKLFSKVNKIRVKQSGNSILSVKALGSSNAYLETEEVLLDASSHRYVVLKAKTEGVVGQRLRLYFQTASEAAYCKDNSAVAELGADWSMVAFDMSKCPAWSGEIQRLMFAFVGTASNEIKVDWLLLTDTLPEHFEDVAGTNETFKTVCREPMGFEDVTKYDWYAPDVEKVYRLGLMNGTTQSTFSPQDMVSAAELITMVIRLNRAYRQQESLKVEQGAEWYTPFVADALEKGIIGVDSFAAYETPVTRKQVAEVLSKALPGSQFERINYYEGIPDLSASDAAYASVLRLYDAGVLTGTGASYHFEPEKTITRAELAAILARVVSPDSRKRVITPAERERNKRFYDANALIEAKCYIEGCSSSTLQLVDGVAQTASVTADPMIFLTKLLEEETLDTSLYIKVSVGMKWDMTAINDPSAYGCNLFFTTSEKGWSADQCLKASWNGQLDENGIGTFVFNIPVTAEIPTLQEIRFDPFDAAGVDFGISYICIE